jgi:hypothetical protein
MKTFADLNFVTVMGEHKQARIDYENGYGVSVIKGFPLASYSPSAGEGVYELAVFHGGRLCYDTPITDNVLPGLSEESVTKYMQQVESLPPK